MWSFCVEMKEIVKMAESASLSGRGRVVRPSCREILLSGTRLTPSTDRATVQQFEVNLTVVRSAPGRTTFLTDARRQRNLLLDCASRMQDKER